jgi:adenylylsulfate kinase-like enzyme
VLLLLLVVGVVVVVERLLPHAGGRRLARQTQDVQHFLEVLGDVAVELARRRHRRARARVPVE